MDISNVSTIPSVEYLVAQYMSIEQQPMVELENQKKEYNLIKTVYTDLKSKLTALRTAANDLKDTIDSKFDAKTASSADESIITASASGDAANGSHDIRITQLAKSDTLVSNQVTRSDTSLATSLGTGTKTFTITINGEATQISVDINDGDDNATILSSISQAINDSDAEVSASVVNDSGTTAKLALRSENSGSDYSIQIADDSGSIVSALGLDPSSKATDTTGGYIYEDSELDAQFVLDGINITSSSNTVDDVLEGVTLTLKSEQGATDDTVQFTIESDSATVQSNLDSFFEKYNDVLNYIQLKTAVDPELEVRGELAGDYTFINLRISLRTLASSTISGIADGNPSMISQIGIEPDRDGNLSVKDADELAAALEANPSQVADLFTSDNGIATQIYDLLTPYTKTGGLLDDDSDALDTRIRNIDDHIDNLETRLSWKEQSYRDQFTKLQQAFVAISNQQSMLTSLQAYY